MAKLLVKELDIITTIMPKQRKARIRMKYVGQNQEEFGSFLHHEQAKREITSKQTKKDVIDFLREGGYDV